MLAATLTGHGAPTAVGVALNTPVYLCSLPSSEPT